MDYLRLDEICSLNMGQSPSSDSYNQERVGIAFFQGNADFGEMYPITRVWCDKPTKIVDRGTLLISVRAPIGALNFAAENSIFMKQLLENLIIEYKKQISAGTAYAALTISGLTKMRVYDVPKEFQDKYADFVHKADKLKLSVTKNLEKIETLKSALMQKFFS